MTTPNRTRTRLTLTAVLLLPLLLTACDNFERDAYRALKLAQVEYELLQNHAARARVRGLLAPAQWDRFAQAGHRFIAAHTLAADLLETYSRAKATGGDDGRDRLRRQVQTTLARLPVLLAGLRNLLGTLDSGPGESTTPPASEDQLP